MKMDRGIEKLSTGVFSGMMEGGGGEGAFLLGK